MSDIWILIILLAFGTFAIRLAGFLFARSLPSQGAVAHALNSLPGTLIVALLTVILVRGSVNEWIAAGLSLIAAIMTRSLPLTMVIGIGSIWLLRNVIGL